ncbi:MAG: hypothetical protein M1818_003666 [Claussenomyces sp. TS43310]|nr:MAG: hypothetical protein M1818_003666 [Claussenomyces sp. TS43310]
MYISNIAAIGLLAVLSHASPAPRVLHERRDLQHDAKWIRRGEAPAGATMPVRIAINQRNLDRGHDMLMEVSDPSSPNYGKHLTASEVADLFSPRQDSIDAVSEWLTSSGIGADRHAISPGKSWIKFDASVEELESLLQAKYNVFTHAKTGEDHVACDEYHVPHTVHPHIDFITPTIGMHASLKKKVAKRAKSSVAALPPITLGPVNTTVSKTYNIDADTCYKGLTPACIQKAYGIPTLSSAQSGNQLGIFEDGDYYDQADLNQFWSQYTTNVPSGTGPKLDSVDGGEAPESQSTESEEENGEESLLDFEVATSLIYPQTTILYQVDDSYWAANSNGFGNTFLDALDASYCTFEGGDDKSLDPTYPDSQSGGYKKAEMCGTYTPTNVISISYGLSEADLPSSYETRQCQEYMKLGLQGVSVIYASGDSGVASRDGCLGSGSTFAPGYPATCPYVTSVGATQVNKGATITAPESAVSDPDSNFYSGGGFSNTFAAPSYQSSALNTYFADHKPSYGSSVYNASGRGFPDVAAVGLNIVNVDGGSKLLQGGTSASAPIFASIITLINEQRLAAGKKPAGFLNPTLYANPSAFNDVRSILMSQRFYKVFVN